jgi:hypothetical protein
MISTTSLSAFSTPANIGAARPAQRPHHPPGVQEARAQPKQQLPLQAQPDKPGAAPPPGQTLPRGSLLDLSV